MAHFRDRRAFGNVGTRRFRGARYGDGKSPRFTGILDSYPGADLGISLRTLSSNWLTSGVIRSRRVNTPLEADFTATEVSNGEFDTWTLGGDAFLPTWYDQSGNGNNASQVTTTDQPKISSSGSQIADGPLFDGTDDTYSIDVGSSPSQFTISSVVSLGSFNDNARLFQFGTSNGSTLGLISDNTTTFTVENFIRTSGTNGRYRWDIPVGEVGILTMVADYVTFTNTRLYWNGVELTRTVSVAPVGTWTVPTGNFLNIAGPVLFSMINVKELLFWPSDQSANRVGIETSINDYYSIY